MRNLALIVLLSISSISLWAQDICPEVHHIVLIHGIGGSANTFGELPAFLKKTDPCYRPQVFVYDTGNSSLSTTDFAQSLETFISAIELKDSDKVSLIMHSQGGIIGNLWLGKIKESDPSLYGRVESFLTLSTPHWGSEMAHVGKRVLEKIPQKKLGLLQLNEMSYGSASIKHLSSLLVKSLEPHEVRFLAVGGIHRVKNRVVGENDVVVPIYSSRPDHYRSTQEVSMGQGQGHISAKTFTKLQRVPFTTVAATHFKFDLPGIVTIPEECVKVACAHPSLPIITDHLKGRSIASTTEEFSHFRSHLYLTNSSREKIPFEDVTLEVLEARHVKIPLAQRLRGYKGKAALREGMAFSFHGFTKQKGIQTVRLKLTVKKRFIRTIDVPVEGGYASILTLDFKN